MTIIYFMGVRIESNLPEDLLLESIMLLYKNKGKEFHKWWEKQLFNKK